MTDRAVRPLLFLDVDGTLLPYRGARLPSTPQGWEDCQDVSNPQLANIDVGHGPRLLALPCDLMWATAWMEDANEVIAPPLGLPALPVTDLPDLPQKYEADTLNWKTRALVRAAAGHPFIWVDDSITDIDHARVSTHHREHALLQRVDSMIGLTDTDFAVIDDWLLEPIQHPWRTQRRD
ncbi:HAD domain-containing protein [Streptomyces mirabilis]|uniref:HAD domain-containing protein n=1 Tax=Streptomyces mirabilis TaxID=68239 RepID=UPI00331E0C1A